jgi:hypothetical protein
MNQAQRKLWIVERLQSGEFESIFSALPRLGGELASLEGVPFGMRNLPTELCVDLSDEKISAEESIKKLISYVHAIPDHA